MSTFENPRFRKIQSGMRSQIQELQLPLPHASAPPFWPTSRLGPQALSLIRSTVVIAVTEAVSGTFGLGKK